MKEGRKKERKNGKKEGRKKGRGGKEGEGKVDIERIKEIKVIVSYSLFANYREEIFFYIK